MTGRVSDWIRSHQALNNLWPVSFPHWLIDLPAETCSAIKHLQNQDATMGSGGFPSLCCPPLSFPFNILTDSKVLSLICTYCPNQTKKRKAAFCTYLYPQPPLFEPYFPHYRESLCTEKFFRSAIWTQLLLVLLFQQQTKNLCCVGKDAGKRTSMQEYAHPCIS